MIEVDLFLRELETLRKADATRSRVERVLMIVEQGYALRLSDVGLRPPVDAFQSKDGTAVFLQRFDIFQTA